MRIFIFLHIAVMFAAVAAALGPAYLLQRIGRSMDVPAIRRSFALAAPLVSAVPILYGIGAALGVVAIFTNGLNPFAPFLLIAYALFLLAGFVFATVNGPWQKLVTQLAAASADQVPSAELNAALRDPRMAAVAWFDPLLVLAFIFDMVVKPFS